MGDFLHVRVVAPADICDAVEQLVDGHPETFNVVNLRDVVRRPDASIIELDVTAEAANDLLDELKALRAGDVGSITVTRPNLVISSQAAELVADDDAAVLWDEVSARVLDSSTLDFGYAAYFVVAAVIAAAGVLSDSPILIVGAMVVGPEFGALAAIALGLQQRRWTLAGRGLRTMSLGALAGIGAACALALLLRLIDKTPSAFESGDLPATSFITEPDLLTAIVACAAGVAGVLALTQDRAGTLVGVLISVTTIPAIADIGVGIGYGHADRIWGSAAQLGVNITCVVVVGAATLAALRRATPSLPYGGSPALGELHPPLAPSRRRHPPTM